jgi:PIN like domain
VSGSAKPATIRFYIDADVLGLAKVLVSLRSDVTYPGDPGGVLHRRWRPACPIASPDTDDEIWIPETARHGWLIITRDSAIQRHQAEIEAVRSSSARMIALAGDEAKSTWQQLEVVMSQWRAIERRLAEPGPFIYTATRTTLRPFDLKPVDQLRESPRQ